VTLAAGSFRRDARVIGLVGSAHFMSHFYLLCLPPLFPLLKGELGVNYVALGLAMTTFNVASGLTQVPTGFLVDRLGPRKILLLGIVVEAMAFTAIGVFGTYEALIACMLVAGVANSAYHPADYAILSASIGGERMGRAFSLHTFAGFAGNAVAPIVMVTLTALWDWRIALMLTGGLGVVVAIGMVLNGSALGDRVQVRGPASAPPAGPPARDRLVETPPQDGLKLLFSAPVLMCFLFFVMLSMSSGGINAFAVSALVTLYDTPLSMANMALTAFLACSALGILAGGIIADRTAKHEQVASVGFATTAVIIALIGSIALPALGIVLLLGLGGLLWGTIMPSRDMLVRAVTPAGATGKVFGFVSTGLNIGSAITPAIFGWILDQGDPRWLFWLAAIFMVLALGTVFATKAVGRASA
jgi:MFS family permease